MAQIPQLAPLPRDATREEIEADLNLIRNRVRASRSSLVVLLAIAGLLILVTALLLL